MALNIKVSSSDWIDLRTRGYTSGMYLLNAVGAAIEYSTAATPVPGTTLVGSSAVLISGTYLWVRGYGDCELYTASEWEAANVKTEPLLVSTTSSGRNAFTAGGITFESRAWSIVGRSHQPKFSRSDIASLTSRVLHVLPCGVDAIKLVFASYYSRVTGNGECPFPNPVFVAVDIFPVATVGNEALPSVGVSAAFRGQRWAVLGRGAILASDPINVAAFRGKPLYIKTWQSANIPAAPTAPTLAQAATGGALSNGTYKVSTTLVYGTAGLESQASAGTSITLTGGTATQKITVTAPTDPLDGAIGYRVWLTAAGGAEPYYDAGGGVYPFGVNADIKALAAGGDAAALNITEIVIPSKPKLLMYSGGVYGGTAAGANNSGEGIATGVDYTGPGVGVAIDGALNDAGAFGPVAVLGLTSGVQPSVAIVGDSIANGFHDHSFGGQRGFVARAVQGNFSRVAVPSDVPLMGLIDLSQASETPNLGYGVGARTRSQLAALARSVISNHGTNGIAAGASSTIKDILGIADQHIGMGKRYFHTTLFPRHSSTDGYRTIANFVQDSPAREGARRQVNAWLRSGEAALVSGEAPYRVSGSNFAPSYNCYGGGDGSITTFITRLPFVQGSETVTGGGSYTYSGATTIDGTAVASGVIFSSAPASGADVRISYTPIPGLTASRPSVKVFDTAAACEYNAAGALDKNGGWFPPDRGIRVAERGHSGASSTQINDPALVCTLDQHRSYTLTIVSDTTTPGAVGQSRLITANTTAGYFTVTPAFSPTPSAASTYIVSDVATADGTHPCPSIHIDAARVIDPSLF